MTPLRLVLRSLTYHWRTNSAVALGVAAAVSVLAGALIVGDSVRGSLRAIALGRLGNTYDVLSSSSFFRDALAADMAAATGGAAAPLVAASAFVTHEPSGRRAANVLVYGVDERFWTFHGLEAREGVYVSPALAAELGASQNDVLLARLQKPSAIPIDSLFAHKDDLGRTVRLTMTGALPREQLGEFALQPQQAEIRAVFAPLRRIQRDLGVQNQANTVLLAEGAKRAEAVYRQVVSVEDLGLRVRPGGDGATVSVEHASGILGAAAAAAAEQAGAESGLTPQPVFAYLANSLRKGDRAVPYSLVAALDLSLLPTRIPPTEDDYNTIVLNTWTARELGAAPGDAIEIEYYLWDAADGLRTVEAPFTVSAITPMTGVAADRTLAPEYPGISEAATLTEWDPPFPLDLSKVRPQDEQYWEDFRATPKAFLPYNRGRDLWNTRYGTATSIRFAVPAGQSAPDLIQALRSRLQSSITPASMGVTLMPVRTMALTAASGATDFGEYFTYFSFFLVVSALLLAVLFFRLGVEQRFRQIGILRASGYPIATIRRLLVSEALLLATIGAAVGMAGALVYAFAIVYALRTWWVGAVGTTLLEVHAGWRPLALGGLAGIVAAIVCVAASLRAVASVTPRSLLTGQSLDTSAPDARQAVRRRQVAMAFAAIGVLLLVLGFLSDAAQAGAFFGAGASLLAASLLLLSAWLREREPKTLAGHGPRAVARLGFRSAAFRPSRSVLSAALIASATFIIVSVEAFRRGAEISTDPHSGTGGFALLAKSEVPLLSNPNDAAGREALLIRAPELQSVTFARFRIRPGDDASCLNLYRPGTPTLIAPEAAFVDRNRFSFTTSEATTDEERANPWRLLQRQYADGSVPAIADATSLQYVLHAAVGDVFTMDIGAPDPVRLRFVGALRDSVLQGELIIAEERFSRLFPARAGHQFFLIDAPSVRSPEDVAALAGVVERELDAFGVDAISTAERLAAFHRVENTYLSTFQALGGLGLMLGTIGLATVMFRNVLERRRELALLRAVGYNARHVSLMIVAEATFVLVVGLAAGVGCAAIAIAPAWLGRGGSVPGPGVALLLGGVAVAGLLSSIVAARAALRGEVLRALRAE
jgi:hypothetical protein